MYQNLLRHRVGLYEKALPNELSWEDKLSTTKELGFDFLEISVDESDERRSRLDWNDEEVYALRRLCEMHGVPLQSMCLSAHRKFPFGSADPAIREQAVIHMEKAISLAYKLGIRTIQLAGYDVYYEPADKVTHQRFIEGMRLSAQLAERSGVMLAVEIMDTDYLNSLSKFEVLSREVNSPYFTAYPDVGNISGWNYDIVTELKLSKPHITQIHLKDTYKVTDEYKGQFRDLVIGDGEVDFNAIFETLKETECVVPLVIEMWAQDERWKENILTAQKRLNEVCVQTGVPMLFDH
ncbi:putative L-xylulose 5-phosphate 3-epimerase [Vibrio crassostreae]|uniref:L-ribulose-5-phosphate 3-epimerase ulaE n=1 Tax=Vibrio crassostreae TaxID=246167 RepID=A0A822N5R8_9VIBR|nr:L-ribulose-5-phosphate 3-epimerase [Vibrio crassostreae]MDH5951119.1 L-ribulose-5-phosphate 3-epimerase [Vibrio crassostreae]TCN05276.1 L-ribulose-5-phosphate 3-epimerase/hexulose-6-phosphate isomerase [Vibrio crassostreae]TCT66007.1 L-ribulose-5-phosphate 3-epimerase/hexulose-6-phosphate isomerase [Vibrio crassostreae]TCT71601.1 L-ribulose-5-phosphate 3-epimerase/hexulose-6-phosphate isomerase [Vibrio crassostreae]TCT86070.1 L-ribulose-5-phosphate 3-epimerase/hexulose-6-phosphate isomerase